MAQLFEVITHFAQEEKCYINPLNVTLIRPVVVTHDGEMQDATEILFVNTMGPQSSLVVNTPLDKVRMHLNDALRGH